MKFASENIDVACDFFDEHGVLIGLAGVLFSYLDETLYKFSG